MTADPSLIGIEAVYEGHFEVVALTNHGYRLLDFQSEMLDVPVPEHLRHPDHIGWTISGKIAKTANGLRWAEVWIVYPDFY